MTSTKPRQADILRHRIGARILAGFGLIVLLALLVGLISLVNVMTVNRRLEDVAERDRAVVTNVLTMQLAAEQQWAAVRSYVLSEDARDLEAFESGRERFATSLAALDGTLDHPWASAHLLRIRQLDSEFAEAARRQIVLMQQGWRATPRVATVVGGQNERDALLDEIRAFDRWQTGFIGQETQSARDRAVFAMGVAIGLVGLAGIVSTLIALLLTRSITRPIHTLAGVADELKSGNLDVHVPAMGSDEIGTLAQTMDQMAMALKASRQSLEASLAETELRNRELTVLNTVAAGASSLDRREVLSRALETILAFTGDDAAGIFVREEDGRLVAAASSGVPEALKEPAQIEAIARGLDQALIVPGLACLELDREATEPADMLRLVRQHGVRSVLAVPLTSQGAVVGVLAIGSGRGRRFGSDEIALLCSIGNQLGISVENAQLVEQLEAQVTSLSITNEVSRAISAVLDLQQLCQVVYEECRRAVDMPTFTMALWDEAREELTPALVVVDEVPQVINPQWPVRPALALVVARDKQPLMTNDYYGLVQDLGLTFVEMPDPPVRRSWLGVPIIIGDRLLGAIIVSTPRRLLKQSDLALMVAISQQAAVAIENARLYEQTKELGVIEERNRMAREIHDTIAQGLTGIVLQLEATSALLDSRPERARQRLIKATELARGTLSEARRSVWNMRPQPLEDLSLYEAIQVDAARLVDDGVAVQCDLAGDAVNLAPETENAIYRIAQEALQNIRKHARATEVELYLTFDDHRLQLTISDNGRGFSDDQLTRQRSDGGGFGLLGMRERARLVGGFLEVHSEPGSGTVLVVTAPYEVTPGIPRPTQPASPTATRALIP